VSSLLLSPAASGKIAHLIHCIRQVKAANPLSPVLVIVPNQLQAAAFRRRLAEAGGALGIDVLTFYMLYAEILARAGQPVPALLDPLQIRLLRAIVDDLCERGMMQYYVPLRKRPGFILALRNVIQELKRARVFPEDFALAVQELGPHLTELGMVYTAYQDWLRREDWADLEGRGWLAALALEQNAALAADLRLLAVTGFDEFNPTQLSVLARLASRAQETLISLTGSEVAPQRLAHRRFQRARQSLAEQLDLQVETLAPVALLAPAIAHLETNLFEKRQTEIADQQSVELLEAQTRAAEARAALRWVKARIVRDGLALTDVAVFARDPDAYRPFLEETAAEFGMPLRIVSGLPLAQNPAVVALLSLLALPVKDWPRRPCVESWRSSYFDWADLDIQLADAVALDAISRQGRVSAGYPQWHEAFDLLEQQKAPENFDEVWFSLGGESDSKGMVVPLRRKFEAFYTRLTPPAGGTVREYISFIEDLIGDDPVLASRSGLPRDGKEGRGTGIIAMARANPATAGRDVAALRSFKDVLRGLALADVALKTPARDYPAFYDELLGAVEASTYTSAAETGILVASVMEARGLSFRAVALLGLSEGEFPRREREDTFLNESDRQKLRDCGIPLQSRLLGDEATFFYQAITRGRERLLLSRPYLADDGQLWEASPYWNQAHRLLGRPVIRRIRAEDVVSVSDAASGVEWSPDPFSLQRGCTVLQTRMSRSAASPYEGELPELAQALVARYSASFGWSASKLEAYGTCPFYFYVAYALDLEARTPSDEGYDVRILGSMLHKILEDTYAQAQDPTNVEDCISCMEITSRQVFAAAPADYGFRPTQLWAQQQDELSRALRQTVVALAEASQGYTPRFFEEKFGMGKPSLILKTDVGDIRLHGFIDRLDVAPDGHLRVIDYKSSGAAINPKHLSEGIRLQLPLYALAASKALGLGEIADGFYWHIQQAEASSLKLNKYPGGVSAACDTAISHVARHLANIRSGKFQPEPPAEGCPAYCPAVKFCWRYQSKGF